ncbi:MAG: hypothetical protein GWN21_07255 [Gammaproteobacteria bacterium]|nr:hypothetical protein [Gammaproteobacteria bacterium]NIP88532.1 hypothetical protein [Gammaproteobacteria bacterium]NIR23253.1 hypothetical protein [Gammaproteobacteria bacterium]NIS04824.1 hypothetical protein [Gammaproteobacteria bacterium]NIU40102.1 hypothetical protein [Gammaproteobacteria bacterium]
MKRHNIPDDVLLFAGYTLAHAAYSISDVEEGELLIPFAMTEVGGEQNIARFESDSQADAIASGKRYMASMKRKSDLWTLAREGTIKAADEKDVDALVVSAGCTGLEETLAVIQPFRPNRGRDEFAILPTAAVVIGGQIEEGEEHFRLITIVLEGVSYHPKAALWDTWQTRGGSAA